MIGSLYSGISGLKANTSAMAVIGDNIANVDTNGFKSARVSFANVFSSTLSQTHLQIGRGVVLSGVTPQWHAGTLENTNSATDLSINGSGLFVVSHPNEGEVFYTRAGNFQWDRNGHLASPDGLVVQGYSIDTAGNVGAIGNVALPNGTSAPSATTNMTFGINLSSDAADGTTFNTSITTFNSLGSEVILDLVFTRNGNVWDWAASVDPAVGTCAATGTIAFDTAGALDPTASSASDTDPRGNPVIAITGLAGAVDPMEITWTYLNEAGASDGSITGYSGASARTAQNQDGYSSGRLQSVSVDENGYFTGLYSNGSLIPFAQIALADFPSYAGLAKRGNNLYSESLSSGQPVIGPPNTASLGTIAPSTLEMSNVDLATEFVEMITTQRAFQANSKVISTSDEILAELLSIKR
jgi:flagellar hook protein FlgE